MEIKYFNGDVFNSNAQLILHGVNCLGVMGSGIAKTVKERFPNVYEEYHNLWERTPVQKNLLGMAQKVDVTDDFAIVNCFTQEYCGCDGKRYTSYDAVAKCFEHVAKNSKAHNIKKIALPYGMCSVRGGACWEAVVEILKDSFKDTDITIEIWKY